MFNGHVRGFAATVAFLLEFLCVNSLELILFVSTLRHIFPAVLSGEASEFSVSFAVLAPFDAECKRAL